MRIRTRLRNVATLALLLVLVGSSLRPVSAGPAADQIRLLEERVSALEARITALEARPWPTTSTPSATPSATPSPAPSPTPTPTPQATPSPTPVASATPSPTPSAAPSATPTSPTSSPTGSVPAFGTRPTSAAISLRNCSNVVIEDKTFKDLGADVIAIRLENCDNVTVRNVDFVNVSEGVYALNSTNIRVESTRYKNITGPYERVGKNRANLVQFNNVRGGSVSFNKGKCGDTEDIVSVYASHDIVVEGNHFEGVATSTPGCLAWRSGSGSGIALGDAAGSGNVARNNVLVNVGQVGMFIAGGLNHQMVGNIVIGQAIPRSNVGAYVWNQSSSPCSGHTVSSNRVRWLRADGVVNGFWNANNCGSITGLPTNNWNDTTLNIENYRVVL